MYIKYIEVFYDININNNLKKRFRIVRIFLPYLSNIYQMDLICDKVEIKQCILKKLTFIH